MAFSGTDITTILQYNQEVDDDEEIIYDKTRLLNSSKVKQQTEPSPACSGVNGGVQLILIFVCVGISLAMPGPTLLYFENLTNAREDQVSLVFTGRAVGGLGGWLLASFLLDHTGTTLGPRWLCGTGLLGLCVTHFLVPWTNHVWLLMPAFAAQGATVASVMHGGMALLDLQLRPKTPQWRTLLMLALAFGCFLAPLLAMPFLNNSPPNLATSTTSIASRSRVRRDVGNSSLSNNTVSHLPAHLNESSPSTVVTSQPTWSSSTTGALVTSHLIISSIATPQAEIPSSATKQTPDSHSPTPTAEKPPLTDEKHFDQKSTAANTPTSHLPTPAAKKPSLTDAKHLNQESTAADGSKTGNDLKKIKESDRRQQNINTQKTKNSPSTISLSSPQNLTRNSHFTTRSSKTTESTIKRVTANIGGRPATSSMTTSRNGSSISIHQSLPGYSYGHLQSSTTVSPAHQGKVSKPPELVPPFNSEKQLLTALIGRLKPVQQIYLMLGVLTLFIWLVSLPLTCPRTCHPCCCACCSTGVVPPGRARDGHGLSDEEEDVDRDDDMGKIATLGYFEVVGRRSTDSSGYGTVNLGRAGLVALLGAAHLVYAGVEVAFGGFAYSFAVHYLHWSHMHGLMLTAAFWLGFFIGRLPGLLSINLWRPNMAIVGHLVVAFTGGLVLTLAANNTVHLPIGGPVAAFWMGTLLLGIGFAGIQPALLTTHWPNWLTIRLIPTSRLASYLGELILPVMIAYVHRITNSPVLLKLVLASSIVIGGLFLVAKLAILLTSAGGQSRDSKWGGEKAGGSSSSSPDSARNGAINLSRAKRSINGHAGADRRSLLQGEEEEDELGLS